MFNIKKSLVTIVCCILLSLCFSYIFTNRHDVSDPVPGIGTEDSTRELRKVLRQHPEIVLDVIRDNPLELQKIIVAGQRKAYQESIAKIRNEELKNPKSPAIGKSLKPMPGSDPDAPVTVVIYSSFQCPNCAQAAATVDELMKLYPGKLKVYYKHSTGASNLAFQQALAFESTLLQSPEKAWSLHNYMFENMATIRADGLSAVLPYAKKIGIDMKQFSRDMNHQVVLDRLRTDMEENQSFGIQYTPTVMINGISVIGTRPLKEYTDVIDHALKGKEV